MAKRRGNLGAEREAEIDKVRQYVRQVDGEAWADRVNDARIDRAITMAKAVLRPSGKSRGWLGAVHAALKNDQGERSRGE